tara:strand:+ start:2849 stop:3127 length:279 start_codon:yes stop_codon:yes gene_type:complete
MHLFSKMAGRTAKNNMGNNSESEELVSIWSKIKYWMIQIVGYLGGLFVLLIFALVIYLRTESTSDLFILLLAIVIVIGPMIYVFMKEPLENE